MLDTTDRSVPAPRPAVLPERPPPVIEAEAPRTRGVMLFGLLVMFGFFGGFMAWAVFAPLSEAAIAPGMIKVEGTRRTLQHLEGGMVREIMVRDGDQVREGQVLMRLDDVQSGSAVAGLVAQRDALMAQQARLTAELERAENINFPPALLASRDPRAAEAVAGQRALFQARQASLSSQLSVLTNRRDQARGTIASAEGQIEAARRQLTLLVQEEAMRRGLVQQGLARLPELLALQRQLAATEGLIADLTGQIRRANAAVEEAESQTRQTVDQRLQEVGTEMREVVGRLAEVEERLRAAADISTRRDIVAPEDGTIVNLRVFNLGAVLRPGDPAMELVPVRDRLIAEVQVQPMDIDVVFTGLPAEIRLPAFKQRLVPFLHGEVSFVAPDITIDPQTRASHYRAHIRIDAEQLARLPAVFLTPGMPVEAHIQLGSRTFWRYITQPVVDSFHRAFQEP
ncbi:HlyD family type I secretion periplasmic adaptor subunit [Roseococcus sp. SDR]|uniref:HlyD family type I secretion periplasmic adaptor subunit n=1 Tax=Roseococcus sp. SDR TaxID=2835532 RepID=UPI001BCEFB54|nr:HlyD family type I secretion periplasmic adaptor subunit [Roseococcus sp. SDR]MBS7790059.1 HlyD family type I secretion periplasmic adaptor subunit [Roseococcus sp. SDR]MBV1845373.1 HlyD family type I secretion periplasmic adaptor subunit [Roseococcus sp. SDR]